MLKSKYSVSRLGYDIKFDMIQCLEVGCVVKHMERRVRMVAKASWQFCISFQAIAFAIKQDMNRKYLFGSQVRLGLAQRQEAIERILFPSLR